MDSKKTPITAELVFLPASAYNYYSSIVKNLTIVSLSVWKGSRGKPCHMLFEIIMILRDFLVDVSR